jgi:hypothetical protein
MRIFRLTLTTGPLIAIGFFVGLGLTGRRKPDTVSHRSAAPDVDLQVVGEKEERASSEREPVRVAPTRGERLLLRGAGLAQVEMGMTHLPPEKAITEYDEKFRAKGWRFEKISSKLLADFPDAAAARVYSREGVYRLVLIGEALDVEPVCHPVTVFEGALRGD